MAAQRNHPRPEYVFVGTKTYEVHWLNEDEWYNNHLNEGDAGVTYASRNAIYMRLLPGAIEANYQEVLVHEVTHAIWAETHLGNMTEEIAAEHMEETVIGIQSHGLLFVLQQNPQLVAYLTSNGAVRRRA